MVIFGKFHIVRRERDVLYPRSTLMSLVHLRTIFFWVESCGHNGVFGPPRNIEQNVFISFLQTPATAAGGFFALCQSAGVLGLAASTKAAISAVAGAVVSVAAYVWPWSLLL